MVRKVLIVAPGVAVIVGLMMGCGDKSNNPPAPQERLLLYSQSDCLPGSESSSIDRRSPNVPQDLTIQTGFSPCLPGTQVEPTDGLLCPGGQVSFGVSYDTLFVYHDSAYYNCCASFVFTVESSGTVVDFIEADTSSEHCYCMCRFNLESSVAGMAMGTYTARLWTEGKTKLVGEATITITGASGVLFRTNCDTLFVEHNARWANCGSVFVFDFRQEDHLLVFTEVDTSTQLMYCMCEFDLTANVSDLDPGDYTGWIR